MIHLPQPRSALTRSLFILLLAPWPAGAAKIKRAPKKTAAAPRTVPPMGETGESGRIEARDEWRLQRMTYPTGTMPAGDWRGEALEHIRKFVPDAAPEGLSTLPARNAPADAVAPVGTAWTMIGPASLDNNAASGGYMYGIVAGRNNVLAFQPGSSTVAYAGMTVGGLWKTVNCCSAATTWTPLWDGTYFNAQAAGAIAFDPNDVNVIYAGSGDSQVPGSDMFGNGVYKSTDGGATWTQYGAAVFSPYQSVGVPAATGCCAMAPKNNIKVIAVDPHDSNTVLAGADYGLFISRDAGVTWAMADVVNRNAAPFNDDAQRISSLLLDGNTNPSTIYLAIGYPYTSVYRPGVNGGANGVYKATLPASGNPVFTLKNSGWPANTGAGTANVFGRVELGWNAAHTRIYAYAANYNPSTVAPVGLYTTADGANSWTALTGGTTFTTCGADSAQDWYNLYVAVDPLNDKTLYIGRTNVWKGTVNATYTSISNSSISGVYSSVACGYGTIHPDQHGFAFVPGSNPTRFLAGNDGGVYYGTGAVGGFTQLNGSFNTLQFYAGQLGRDFANTSGTQVQYAFGGFQDNGSASWDSSQSSQQWQARGNGGDGFFGSFDPIGGTLNAGRWITEYTNGAMDCSTTGAAGGFGGCAPAYGGVAGEIEDWSTPFMLDQWNCTAANCNNLIVGSTVVYASTASGSPAWTRTGSTSLTKGGSTGDIISLDMGHANPGSVVIGTNDGNFQWSANVFTGASCTAAAANSASFACAANGAATWVNLTGANAVLPNRSIPGVALDPATNLVFYAAVDGFNINTPATPGHLFRGVCAASPCTAGNVTWSNKSGNLPDVPFTAVAVNPNNTKQVYAGSMLGFFFTEDITAAAPLWFRYQFGMPNTIVSYIAVDRGPGATPRAPTTLGAFTYGRGLYVTRINIPTMPREVAAGAGIALLARKGGAAGTVKLEFEDQPGMAGYNVYEGALPLAAGNPYTHGVTGSACNAATTLAATRRTTGDVGTAGSHYYLATAYNAVEGPSGYNPAGVEIDPAKNSCAPQ
jgi:hypothetical protein